MTNYFNEDPSSAFPLGLLILQVRLNPGGSTEYDYFEYDAGGLVTLHAHTTAVESFTPPGPNDDFSIDLWADRGLVEVSLNHDTGEIHEEEVPAETASAATTNRYEYDGAGRPAAVTENATCNDGR